MSALSSRRSSPSDINIHSFILNSNDKYELLNLIDAVQHMQSVVFFDIQIQNSMSHESLIHDINFRNLQVEILLNMIVRLFFKQGENSYKQSIFHAFLV